MQQGFEGLLSAALAVGCGGLWWAVGRGLWAVGVGGGVERVTGGAPRLAVGRASGCQGVTQFGRGEWILARH